MTNHQTKCVEGDKLEDIIVSETAQPPHYWL